MQLFSIILGEKEILKGKKIYIYIYIYIYIFENFKIK